jgi:hypothetical protein
MSSDFSSHGLSLPHSCLLLAINGGQVVFGPVPRSLYRFRAIIQQRGFLDCTASGLEEKEPGKDDEEDLYTGKDKVILPG